jgi:hypothetical protein
MRRSHDTQLEPSLRNHVAMLIDVGPKMTEWTSRDEQCDSGEEFEW